MFTGVPKIIIYSLAVPWYTTSTIINNNYIVYLHLKNFVSYEHELLPNLHYWLPLLENLGTVKLSCLKHCLRLFVEIIFSRNFMP